MLHSMPKTGGPIIGVPRALLFYEYEPFFLAFFRSLGVPVVLSPPTGKRILDSGTRLSADECCLPVKVFFGHVACLAGQCDTVFVPRVVSVARREYTCPKLLGLPDMVREQVRLAGQNLIDVTVDMYRSRSHLARASVEVARQVGRRPGQALVALGTALRALAASRRAQGFKPTAVAHRDRASRGLAVAVLGHSYLVHDTYLNLRLAEHLRAAGVTTVVTEDDIDPRAAAACAGRLPKPLFWTLEKATVGGALYLLERRLVDGIIQLASFGCGPDSMISTIIESYCRRAGMPYMLLAIDEHTGEAGFRTRAEAFVDMLEWRKREAR